MRGGIVQGVGPDGQAQGIGAEGDRLKVDVEAEHSPELLWLRAIAVELREVRILLATGLGVAVVAPPLPGINDNA